MFSRAFWRWPCGGRWPRAQTDVPYVTNNGIGIGTGTPLGNLDIHDGNPLHGTFAGMGVDSVAGPMLNYGDAGSSFRRRAGFSRRVEDPQGEVAPTLAKCWGVSEGDRLEAWGKTSGSTAKRHPQCGPPENEDNEAT